MEICELCGAVLDSFASNEREPKVCKRHLPPPHIINHISPIVRTWGLDAFDDLRSSYIELNHGRRFFSLFAAHLSIEKMTKCVMLASSGDFTFGHNLIQLLRNTPLSTTPPEWILEFCGEMNVYQTAGRYPSERSKVASVTTDEFVISALQKTEEVLSWLATQMK